MANVRYPGSSGTTTITIPPNIIQQPPPSVPVPKNLPRLLPPIQPILRQPIEPPAYDPYPTIPLDRVLFLQGQNPNDPSALNWEWEPVTQNFVNTTSRQYMNKS